MKIHLAGWFTVSTSEIQPKLKCHEMSNHISFTVGMSPHIAIQSGETYCNTVQGTCRYIGYTHFVNEDFYCLATLHWFRIEWQSYTYKPMTSELSLLFPASCYVFFERQSSTSFHKLG
jgi:hypothetical protein